MASAVRESLVRVEVVPHLQPARVLGAQGGEGGVEDHRIAVAVGVEKPNRPLRRRQHVLGDRHHRRDAAAPAEANDGSFRLLGAEDTRRLRELDGVALRQVVEKPVGDEPARHALDRDGQLAVRRGRTRHGVRAQLLVTVDVHPEGAELPGSVAEGLGEVFGHVEDEGAGVVGLGNDPGDPERVIAVVPEDGVVVAHGTAGRPTAASATPRTWSRGTGRSRRVRSGGRSRCACTPRRACPPDRSACPR